MRYPAPDGFSNASVRPEKAFYSSDFGEFILPYDAVRDSPTPDSMLLEFLQTTHDAAARWAPGIARRSSAPFRILRLLFRRKLFEHRFAQHRGRQQSLRKNEIVKFLKLNFAPSAFSAAWRISSNACIRRSTKPPAPANGT